MYSKTDWFLGELDSQLQRRVAPEKRAEIVAEIADHLSAAAQEGEEAQALERLGSARKLAIKMLNSQITDEPKWIRFIVAALLILVPNVWLFALTVLDHKAFESYMYIAMIMGATALLASLLFRKLRLKEVLLAPIVGFAMMAVGLSFTFYDMGELDGYHLFAISELDELRSNYPKNEAVAMQAKALIRSQDEGKFLNNSVFVRVNREDRLLRIITISATTSKMASETWAKNRMFAKDSLAVEWGKARSGGTTLSEIPAAQAIPGWKHGLSIVFWTLVNMPGILFAPLMFNLIGVLFHSIWRRRIFARRRLVS
jgi:hypothetical protein